MTLHPRLHRQLQKLEIDPESADPEWLSLFSRISQSYVESDQERYRLERSMQICSDEMSELNVSLAEERDQLRAIFESAAVGIVRATIDGRIVDCNGAYAEMLGRTKDEVLGHRWFDFVHEDETDVQSKLGPLERPIAYERRYRHKDGSTVWGSVSVATVREPNGTASFNIAVVNDRTQEKELEISLRHAQKLEAVGRLAAGMAHEINTPIQFVGDNLTFLRSAVERALTLRERVGDIVADDRKVDLQRIIDELDLDYVEQQIPEAIDQSLAGIEHVGNIVQAMKFMSHDKRTGDLTTLDVNLALKNIATVATPETKYVADLSFEAGAIVPILASPTDLSQVFLNLIVNAAHAIADVVKTTRKRGVIRVKTWMDGDDVLVSIADTGTGIPEAARDKIFDPFFTTKEVGRGSGQGLAIARSVVISHGGTISFDTQVGSGTTFLVRLPSRRAQRSAA